MRASLLFALALGGAIALAQRSGTFDLNRDTPGHARTASLLDQIEDPAERKAFEAMYRKMPAPGHRAAAEDFLKRYPQSWFLAQAFEILAKACIELEDYPCALGAGRASLRLLPENPLLLVPLANVQATTGDNASAIESGQKALELLDRFNGPHQFSEKAWKEEESALRASSNYVIGKAMLAEAMRLPQTKRPEGLAAADRYLSEALWLAPSDGRIGYMLGMSRILQLRPHDAAVAFASVYEQSSLQGKVREHLSELYSDIPGPGRPAFDVYVKQLADEYRQSAAKAHMPAPSGPPISGYAGIEVCRECHPDRYATWRQTGHSKMFRPYVAENVLGDFNNRSFENEKGEVVARMTMTGDQHTFQVRGPRKEWLTYKVDFTIGSKWQQTYATRLSNGEIHVFPLQYNVQQRKWVDFWKTIDPPGTPRDDPDNFYKHSRGTAYITNCAPCHTSQLQMTGAGPATPENATFRQGGINCEVCHGPAANHVAAMRSGDLSRGPLVQQFGKLSAKGFVAFCSMCHMQSAERDYGPNGECNFRQTGNSFFPHYRSTPYTEFMRSAFYKDGRFRVVNFVVEAFVRSACYRKGQANCGSCHDPHPADARINQKSLKAEFLTNPDGMCLQCHGEFATNPASHTHHSPESPGSRCVSCHMPKIMESVLFKAMSHQIDEIPDAEMTARFGPQDSPNACLGCHEQKDAEWLGRTMRHWYPSKRSVQLAAGSNVLSSETATR
jgi:predicted CXXCH cytochrome family protein